MNLSDVVSHAGMARYAEIALIIALISFAAIVVWVFARRNKERYERAKMMPLDDDQPQERRGSMPGPTNERDGAKDE